VRIRVGGEAAFSTRRCPINYSLKFAGFVDGVLKFVGFDDIGFTGGARFGSALVGKLEELLYMELALLRNAAYQCRSEVPVCI